MKKKVFFFFLLNCFFLQANPDVDDINEYGFELIDQKKYVDAYQAFKKAMGLKYCMPDSIDGLYELLQIFSKDFDASIYLKNSALLILDCEPDNVDALYFLALSEYRLGEIEASKKSLMTLLQKMSDYKDADLLLGQIYIREKDYQAARVIFLKYSDDLFAKEKLADISLALQNYEEASSLYSELLQEDSNSADLEKKYIYSLTEQKKYRLAKKELSNFLKENKNSALALELYEIKNHVDPQVSFVSSYIEAKEADPTLNQYVVRDYYLDDSIHLIVPARDVLNFDTKVYRYQQKEKDIYPPIGVNYDVQIYGVQEKIKYAFLDDLAFDFTIRGLFASQISGHYFYPFMNTNRFEPGVTFSWINPRQFFFADAHIESFIIKNFQIIKSQLLRTDYLDVGYGYHFDTKFGPEIEGFLTEVFYHDSLKNREWIESLIFRFKVPSNKSWLKGIYKFAHSGFKYLSTNYFSYYNQWINQVGLEMHAYFTPYVFFDVHYEHTWQVTRNLYMPIGNFVYIAARQSLICNKVSGEWNFLFNNQANLKFYAHYYQNNLPYHEYQVKGSLAFQF